MNEKRPGICTNGGCPRLATVEVVISPGIGRRHVCEPCWRSLDGYGMDIRRTPVIFPRQPQPVLGGAA